MHGLDRVGLGHRPGLQALQQLHAAQRQRQGAGVGRDVARQRPGVKQGNARPWQRAGGVQAQGQAHGPGADDGDAKRVRGRHRATITHRSVP